MQKPSFELRFLHPRYWLLWIGISILWLLVTLLPYRALLKLGAVIGKLLMKLIKKREKTAIRNLELCFPEMSIQQRANILNDHNESLGIALFETGMAWWWPQWRLDKLVSFTGLEHIEQAKAQGKGVLLFATHSFCLEIGGRLFSTHMRPTAVYRPHNNPLMEYLQVCGRLRTTDLIHKRDIRGMISALNNGQAMWYTSDQEFGRRKAVVVPFFGVEEAATVVGASILTKGTNCDVIPYNVVRKSDGSGYEIELSAPLVDFPTGDNTADAIFSNKVIEKSIMKGIGQYMWLHRRFKTRPNEDDPSLYL